MASAIGVETEGQRTKGAWLRNVDIPKIFIDQSGYGFMPMCDLLTNLWRFFSFFCLIEFYSKMHMYLVFVCHQ